MHDKNFDKPRHKGSFNRDARNLLDHSSHVVKVTSVKFVVNCLVVYDKSPWKVIVLSNVEGYSVEQRGRL